MSCLVAILGPTASGKSELALAVAERFGDEIVNYDSIQVYRHFEIGTAKLRVDERRGIPHHLLDLLEPDHVFTAGDFARQATAAIGAIRDRHRLPVLAGGPASICGRCWTACLRAPPGMRHSEPASPSGAGRASTSSWRDSTPPPPAASIPTMPGSWFGRSK